MKIAIGEKVFLIHSGEMGIVKNYYDNSTLLIDIDGDEIPVDIDYVVKASDFGIKPAEQQGTTAATFTERKFDVSGMALVFKAIHNLSGELLRYEIYLTNNFSEHILFDYHFYLNGVLHQKIKKEVSAHEAYFLHEFKTDHMNDGPVFNFIFWIKNAKPHYQNNFEKEIKLKAKQFFQKLESDIYKKDGYFSIEIEKEIPAAQQKKQPEVEKDEDDFWIEKKKKHDKHEVLEKAGLADYIDLHIEKLDKDYELLNATEIIQLQLNQFRNFLEKSIQYKNHKIYAVHGLGKGILKNEIIKILKEYSEIESFNNDYNPRFGFGATEIFFK